MGAHDIEKVRADRHHVRIRCPCVGLLLPAPLDVERSLARLNGGTLVAAGGREPELLKHVSPLAKTFRGPSG